MTLRISIALFALSFFFGAAGSANAAEQVQRTSSTVEMNASTSNKKDFRPKKRKKSKPKKRHCDAY